MGFLSVLSGIHNILRICCLFQIFRETLPGRKPGEIRMYFMNKKSQVPLYFFCCACFVFLTAPLFGQKKYSVTSSRMSFTSNAELELITAASNKVQGLIDPSNNQFAFTVDVKSFQGFNSALQREHFNEKYLESEKFPKARFAGKIIEPIDLTIDGSYDVRAKGDLEIHGQKQTRILKSKISVSKGVINLETRFFVPLADHNISIPTIVSQKIATEIEVEFNATMSMQPL